MSDAVFVDTWGWIALGHRNDSRHEEVKRFYLQLRDDERRIYTSDFVLDEVITLLFRRESFDEAVQLMEGIFAASELEHLVVEKITSARFEEAWKLRLRFDDKPSISFTDLTTMVLMKELDLSEVLTDDDHFIHVGMGFQKVPQL